MGTRRKMEDKKREVQDGIRMPFDLGMRPK